MKVLVEVTPVVDEELEVDVEVDVTVDEDEELEVDELIEDEDVEEPEEELEDVEEVRTVLVVEVLVGGGPQIGSPSCPVGATRTKSASPGAGVLHCPPL